MAGSRNYYLRFSCPDCGATQKVLPAQVGTEIRCGECPAVIIVPSLEDLTVADKLINLRAKKGKTTPVAAVGEPAKPQTPPRELNVVRGHVVSFACSVCHTMMRASEEELGHSIMCPHCFSPVIVGGEGHRKPPSVGQPPSLVLEDAGDDLMAAGDEDDPTADTVPADTIAQANKQRSGDVLQPATPAAVRMPTALDEDDEYRLTEPEERVPVARTLPPVGDRDDASQPAKPSPKPAPSASPREHNPVSTAKPSPRVKQSLPESRSRTTAPVEDEPPEGSWDRSREWERPDTDDAVAVDERDDLPDHPFLTGVFDFLLYPSALKRWIGLCVGTAIVYYFAANAVQAGRVGGAQLFYSLLFAVMAAAAGLLLVTFAAVASLTVVQDTASHSKQVEDWPDFIFVDWAGQAFYVLNALAFSALPGFLLAAFFGSWGPMRWALPGVTAAVLFPIILLSQLDGNSPFSLLTPAVFRSTFQKPVAWLAFFTMFWLVLAAAVGLGAITLRLVSWYGAIAAGAIGFVGTTAMLIASRLIGRLAWFCEEEEIVVPRAAKTEETPATHDITET